MKVVGCSWLTIWDSSKHMKTGSYISHQQIRWNLSLIMPLIPELYRTHTVTVFRTDAGKNLTVQANVCPAGPASISKCTSARGTNTGRKKVSKGRWGGNNIHKSPCMLSLSVTDIPFSKKRPSKIKIIFDFGFIHVGGLRIKWDILTILNGIRGVKKV